jgi:hypothetical protein
MRVSFITITSQDPSTTNTPIGEKSFIFARYPNGTFSELACIGIQRQGLRRRLEMNVSRKLLIISTGVVALTSYLSGSGAEARRAFARGPNGAIGGYASHGAWGQRAGARAFGPNAGAGIREGTYKGAGGGTFNTAGGFGYKRGIGAGRSAGWNGTTANGGSGSGYTNMRYNAQTGQGTRNSSEQFKNAAGQTAGYNGNTSFTKGQGGDTQIDTDHHGDYNVDWAKGQKPVVTSTPASN